MRMILALPLLMLAACDVEKDAANDQTSYELNEQKIEGAAEDVGNTAKEVVTDIGNAAERVGEKIESEVEDVDIDVDIDGRKSGNAN